MHVLLRFFLERDRSPPSMHMAEAVKKIVNVFNLKSYAFTGVRACVCVCVSYD